MVPVKSYFNYAERQSAPYCRYVKIDINSVPDPDVFEPPGSTSVSVIYLYGSGQAKK